MKILAQAEQWPFRCGVRSWDDHPNHYRNDRLNPRGQITEGRPDYHDTGEVGEIDYSEQPPIPGMKVPLTQQQPIQVWRGFNVWRDELPQHMKDYLSGEGGLFPGEPGRPGPEFGRQLLDHLNSTAKSFGSSQLGMHWSTDKDKAQTFVLEKPPGYTGPFSFVPVLVGATWGGLGEDPDRWWGAKGYGAEKEIALLRGAPVKVNHLSVQNPESGEWFDVTPESSQGYA